DQADIDRRMDAERRRAAELELERRSQSVKRDLPRPDMLAGGALAVAGDASIPGPVLELIGAEMRALILRDAQEHPVPDVPPLRLSDPAAAAELEAVSDSMLAVARALVAEEAAAMRGEAEDAYKRLAGPAGDGLWRAAEDAAVWLPQAQAYRPAREIGAADWIEKHRRDLAARREVMAADAARAAKIERKLAVALGGYQARAKTLCESIQAAYSEYEQTRLDSEAFTRLHAAEQATIPARLEAAEAEVRVVETRERYLQSEYRDLLEHRNRLAARLAGHSPK
ncbi:CDC5 cell division cycle 5-like protein, partial [Coemansia nantahalensis]